MYNQYMLTGTKPQIKFGIIFYKVEDFLLMWSILCKWVIMLFLLFYKHACVSYIVLVTVYQGNGSLYILILIKSNTLYLVKCAKLRTVAFNLNLYKLNLSYLLGTIVLFLSCPVHFSNTYTNAPSLQKLQLYNTLLATQTLIHSLIC